MTIIRKKSGNFLEDFRPGQIFRHKVGKTVTEGLVNAFTDFTMTTNPLHKNRRYAQAYGFRDIVLPPGLIMNIVFSQSVEDISENARANLEYVHMRFGAPVYVGDTIEVTSVVLGITPSSRDRDRGIVHVQTTGRNQDDAVVLTYERKVQVWKDNLDAPVAAAHVEAPPAVTSEVWLPPYDPQRPYRRFSHLTNADTYFEDFHTGDLLEHPRGRTVTTDHIALTAMLDNTSQVHSNQHLIDEQPERYIGGRLIVYGGIPFNLCLGLSCPDIGDNALADVSYTTGRHSAPLFAGDTVFATTEIANTRERPDRRDLGIVDTVLRGHKWIQKDNQREKLEIFYLQRSLLVKRRSDYC